VPIGFMHGWTHGNARDDPRYRDRVRLTILAHRAELSALAGR